LIETWLTSPGIGVPLGRKEHTTGFEVVVGVGRGKTMVATLAVLTLTEEATSGPLAVLVHSSRVAPVRDCIAALPITRITSVLPLPDGVTLLSNVGYTCTTPVIAGPGAAPAGVPRMTDPAARLPRARAAAATLAIVR
jgi:hypothetical protein